VFGGLLISAIYALLPSFVTYATWGSVVVRDLACYEAGARTGGEV
jgi:hypothetical protein